MRACASGLGPGIPGGVKSAHYLFFGFVKGRWDFGDGPEEPALPWLCCGQRGQASFPGPWPLAAPGGRGAGEGSTAPSPPRCHSRTSSVFPRLGRAQSKRASGGCCLCVLPRITPTPQGLSLVPRPQDLSLSDKRACTWGERTQAVYSSLSGHPVAVVSPLEQSAKAPGAAAGGVWQ